MTRVCDDPLAEALALAKEIAQVSPDAVAASKRLYNKTYALNDREVYPVGAPQCVWCVCARALARTHARVKSHARTISRGAAGIALAHGCVSNVCARKQGACMCARDAILPCFHLLFFSSAPARPLCGLTRHRAGVTGWDMPGLL